MADEQNEVRRVKWDEIFSFVHIFKSGWAALHLNKLALALAVILLLYVTGWTMGKLWKVCGWTARANEVCLFATENPVKFRDAQAKWKDQGRREDALALARNARQELISLLGGGGEVVGKICSVGPAVREVYSKRVTEKYKDEKKPDPLAEDDARSYSDLLSQARSEFYGVCNKAEALLDQGDFENDVVKAALNALPESKTKSKQADQIKDQETVLARKSAANAYRALSEVRCDFENLARKAEGYSVFSSFTDYQSWCLQGMLRSAWRGNLTGGLDAYMDAQRARAIRPIAYERPVPAPPAQQTPAQAAEGGVVYWILMAAQGLMWLFCQHWVFAGIYCLLALAIWALLGGAIYRIAALNITRGEKISIRQAVRFSLGKFLSFFSAPLILLIVIVALGLGTITLPALAFGNFGGGLVMALLFPLFLIFGMLIAFLTVGLVTGGGLMYPTIAVEGSDSFDGISRSFSYLFNRPSRSIFYAAVAVVYGALCYLLMRLFVFVALAATHCFLALGVIGHGDSLGEGADRMDKLWQAPTFLDLRGPVSTPAMSGWEQVASWFVGFWVSAVTATLLAYLLTYLASASTSIYCLLRNKVDATDLDDVFIEEAEDAAFAAPAAETPAATPSAPPADAAPGQTPQPK